ncbi:MAG: HAMP domain-containing protein, partial [Spirochaetaceae bacterium]|nr:HAMP domain-containing protein [Spirochaetaceae bacterium]
MKILAKLLMGFVAVAMLCGVVGVVGISQLGAMSREITELSDSTIPTIELLHLINKEMLSIKVAVRTLVNPLGVDDEVFIKRQKDNIASSRERYAKLIADFDLLPKTAEEQKLWDAVKAAIPPVKAYNDTLAKLADEAVASRDPLERQAIYAKLYEMVAGEQRLVLDNFLAQVDGVIAYDSKHYGKDVPAAAKAAAEVGRYVLVGVTVVSFAVAIMLGMLLGLSISRSLKRAAAVLDKIALGDLSERMESKSKDEFLQVSRSLNTVADNLRSLIETSESLTDSLVEGKLGFRADAQGFKGAYAELMVGFNTVVDTLVGFIDSMPNPAMVIDENYEILFMNKAGAAMGNLTVDQLVKARRKCYDFFKTGDCKSQRCACTQAMQIGGPANSETAATPMDKTFDIAYTGVPVRDRAGKIVGAFEVISDQTAIKAAERKMKKIAAFQDVEINRLNQNLQKIALGDLSVDLELGESDAETHDTKLRFETIAAAMKRSIDAIGALVSDANLLAEAAVEGKLATRAEAGKHQGDFRRIVEGVNRTLDLVIGPINETTEIMKRLAEGDLTTAMTGAYKGDFDILKTALNESLESINDILSQVNIAVDQVAEGSIQVSQASQALSQGATEQASSLEEITSSVTEISGQTKQNTESAVQVNGLAKTARANADQGNKQMQNLVSAMADINSSAEEIKKIVKA